MNKQFIFIFIYLSFFALSAQTSSKHLNLSKQNLALDGYDAVSYFSGKAEKGNEKFEVKFNGAKYWFASASHVESFQKNPEAFLPQYGGWCAYAIGKENEKVSVDPETFKIVDGKLYLFYHNFLINTLPKWNNDEKT